MGECVSAARGRSLRREGATMSDRLSVDLVLPFLPGTVMEIRTALLSAGHDLPHQIVRSFMHHHANANGAFIVAKKVRRLVYNRTIDVNLYDARIQREEYSSISSCNYSFTIDKIDWISGRARHRINCWPYVREDIGECNV
jgi:hypothetical protein